MVSAVLFPMTGMFNSKIVANNISIIGKEVGAVKLTGEDVSNIKEVGQRGNVLELMSRSLCPSIFGHEFIKKALIMQLLGTSYPYSSHIHILSSLIVLYLVTLSTHPINTSYQPNLLSHPFNTFYQHTMSTNPVIPSLIPLSGGCERNLENGTHLRGDINVMMVGDPSTAKSQLLRAVMDIAPLAISTTGR